MQRRLLQLTIVLLIASVGLILLAGLIGHVVPSPRIAYTDTVNGNPVIVWKELRPYRELYHQTIIPVQSASWSTDGRYIYYSDFAFAPDAAVIEEEDISYTLHMMPPVAIFRYDTLLQVDKTMLQGIEDIEYPMPSPNEQYMLFLEFSELWLYNLDTRERNMIVAPFVLNETNRDVLWSADSRTVFYIYENMLWQYDVKTQQNTVLVANLATINRLHWSQDGREIAYLSNTDNKVHVAAYNITTGTTRILFDLNGEPFDYRLSRNWADITLVTNIDPNAPVLARWQP